MPSRFYILTIFSWVFHTPIWTFNGRLGNPKLWTKHIIELSVSIRSVLCDNTVMSKTRQYWAVLHEPTILDKRAKNYFGPSQGTELFFIQNSKRCDGNYHPSNPPWTMLFSGEQKTSSHDSKLFWGESGEEKFNLWFWSFEVCVLEWNRHFTMFSTNLSTIVCILWLSSMVNHPN